MKRHVDHGEIVPKMSSKLCLEAQTALHNVRSGNFLLVLYFLLLFCFILFYSSIQGAQMEIGRGQKI